MDFAVALFSPPHSPASRRALRFCEAALASGHRIVRLFFYADGVLNASSSVVNAQDEADLPAQWRALIERETLDSVVCIAAALRRGVLDDGEAARYGRPGASVQPPWTLSGLGQLHEANQLCERLLCFGGDA